MLCLAFLLPNAEIWLEFSHDFRELGQHIYGNAKISVKVGQSCSKIGCLVGFHRKGQAPHYHFSVSLST